MNYRVTIFSKNKNSLTNFFKFFNKELLSVASYNMILSQTQKKKTCKTISVLKSPHVNKTAQVHYSYNLFSKQIFIFSSKPMKSFLFFKKIQSRLFPDVKMEVKLFVKQKHTNKLSSKFLNPSNFVIYFINFNCNNQNFRRMKLKKQQQRSYILFYYKILNYLKIFDCYGESVILGFLKNCLDSSVGRAKD